MIFIPSNSERSTMHVTLTSSQVATAIQSKYVNGSLSSSYFKEYSRCGNFLYWMFPFFFSQERKNFHALQEAESRFTSKIIGLTCAENELPEPFKMQIGDKTFVIGCDPSSKLMCVGELTSPTEPIPNNLADMLNFRKSPVSFEWLRTDVCKQYADKIEKYGHLSYLTTSS